MNVFFLSLVEFETFDVRNIYTDLLREFIRNGHKVCCISPVEKRKNEKTKLLRFGQNSICRLVIGNTQKTNLIEKGISILRIESLFINGIKRYYSDIKFDLILYATPPVTFAKVIRYVKKRDNAKSYLMLKDIFPQNAVDLGLLSKSGIKGLIYWYFRAKEKELYRLSDRIGCMSQANVNYLLEHNTYITPEKVEVCPNSIEPVDMRVSKAEKDRLREKYGFPLNKKIFVYGGNLGRPQDVPFIVQCLKACKDIDSTFFVIAGSGTDRHYLDEYVEAERPEHVSLLGHLPKDEYDKMIACCDVGLIFLDHRFTIPNFPSRLLSYMQAGLPVLACTDKNTDVGEMVVKGGFGWWCESDDKDRFRRIISEIVVYEKSTSQSHIREYIHKHFLVKNTFEAIVNNWKA